MLFCVARYPLILACLLIASDISTARYDRRTVLPAGVQLDSSCDQSRDNIQSAVKEVRQLAILGYLTASHESAYFHRYFKQDQKGRVIEVFLNAARSIEGNGMPIIIKCGHVRNCSRKKSGVAFVSKLRIIICDQYLEGPLALPPAGKCSEYAEGSMRETLSMVLLHEIVHLQSDPSRGMIGDYAYDPDKCSSLVTANVRDRDGEELKASENANNFVWSALEAMASLTMTYPERCHSLPSKLELRRLLSVPTDDDIFAKVVKGYNVTVPFHDLPQPLTGNVTLDAGSD